MSLFVVDVFVGAGNGLLLDHNFLGEGSSMLLKELSTSQKVGLPVVNHLVVRARNPLSGLGLDICEAGQLLFLLGNRFDATFVVSYWSTVLLDSKDLSLVGQGSDSDWDLGGAVDEVRRSHGLGLGPREQRFVISGS